MKYLLLTTFVFLSSCVSPNHTPTKVERFYLLREIPQNGTTARVKLLLKQVFESKENRIVMPDSSIRQLQKIVQSRKSKKHYQQKYGNVDGAFVLETEHGVWYYALLYNHLVNLTEMRQYPLSKKERKSLEEIMN